MNDDYKKLGNGDGQPTYNELEEAANQVFLDWDTEGRTEAIQNLRTLRSKKTTHWRDEIKLGFRIDALLKRIDSGMPLGSF